MADGHELTSISSAVTRQDGNALTPTLWACGAASQAMGARMLTKRGDGGLSMPLRAFSIASLVLDAGVCAMGGTLWASGIRENESGQEKGSVEDLTSRPVVLEDLEADRVPTYSVVLMHVEDLRSMGRTIRSALGKPPRTHA